MIKDTVSTKDGLVVSTLSDDLESLEIFLKLTEEHRRERQRRIDAGDETARLKFQPPPESKPVAPKPKPEAEPKADAKPAAQKTEAKTVSAQGADGKGGKAGKDSKSTPAPKVVAGYGSKGKDSHKGKDQKGWGKGKGKW